MAYKKPISTEHLQTGQAQEHIVPVTGDIDRTDFRDNFEIIDPAKFTNDEESFKFMHEKIEVQLNPGVAADEQTVQVTVNGVNQFFIRGAKQWVKRMFVNVLAGAKTEHISTVSFKDALGNDGTKIQKTSVLKYPFTVITDKNPKGREWLEAALASA